MLGAGGRRRGSLESDFGALTFDAGNQYRAPYAIGGFSRVPSLPPPSVGRERTLRGTAIFRPSRQVSMYYIFAWT